MSDGKYLIKVLPAEGCNPEFAPDEEDQEGHELSGFFLMGYDEERNLIIVQQHGISVKNIADGIVEKDETTGIRNLRMAAAIAEGYLKSREIYEQSEQIPLPMFDHAEPLDPIDLLRILRGGEDDDEAGE